MKQTKLILGLAATTMSLASASMAAVFFETFDYGAVKPTVGTDAANLNGSFFQEGTWATSSPALPGASNSPASPELIDVQQGSIHVDRPDADAFIRGDFARPMGLDGTVVDFDFALSRTAGNHLKDVEVVGLDAGGNEAFRLVMSADNTAAQNDARRVGYYTGGGTLLNWDIPDAGDANGDIAPGTGGPYSPAFSSIGLRFSPDGYTIGFARANSYRFFLISYNEATGDLVAIEFHFQGDPTGNNNSGFFLDNIYAGARLVPEPSTATLLILGVIGVRYGRKAFRSNTRA